VVAEVASVAGTRAAVVEASAGEAAAAGLEDETISGRLVADLGADVAAASATAVPAVGAAAGAGALTHPRTDLARHRAKGDLVGTAEARLVGVWACPAGVASASNAKAPAGSTIGRQNGRAIRLMHSSPSCALGDVGTQVTVSLLRVVFVRSEGRVLVSGLLFPCLPFLLSFFARFLSPLFCLLLSYSYLYA